MKTGMLTLIAFSHFIWICAAVAMLSIVQALAVQRRRRPPAEVIKLEHRRRVRRR